MMASADNFLTFTGLEPMVNYNFMLRVEGIFDLPCKAVHSFTRENEFEYIQEGGLNDYVHIRRKPISKPFTFTVERYASVDHIGYDPLAEGAEFTLPMLLLVSRYPNSFDVTRRTFIFTGCVVMSKEYSELNAEQSGLMIEKTVIAYQSMVSVTTPFDLKKDPWKFDGRKVEGNGIRYAAKDIYSSRNHTEEQG